MNPMEEEHGDGYGYGYGSDMTPRSKNSSSSSSSIRGNIGPTRSNNVPVPPPNKATKTSHHSNISSSCNSPYNMAAWERKRKSFRQYYRSLQQRSPPSSSSSMKAAEVVKEEGEDSAGEDGGEGVSCSASGGSATRRYISESELSLTDDDFDEVKGFIDLGFGFDLDQMPRLSNVLPALSVCYAVNQSIASGSSSPSPSRLSDSPSLSSSCSLPPSPRPSWTVSCTGDSPEEVKVRLRQWAQAVGCNLRQASPRR